MSSNVTSPPRRLTYSIMAVDNSQVMRSRFEVSGICFAQVRHWFEAASLSYSRTAIARIRDSISQRKEGRIAAFAIDQCSLREISRDRKRYPHQPSGAVPREHP